MEPGTNILYSMDKVLILPSFYLPPIEYFSVLKSAIDPVLIEKNEHFPKQTYRNRACIHSANGKLDLIVPVVKGAKVHTAMKDVKISYEFDWQRLHWLSLQTSYRSSAFFEFYEDELAPFYHSKWDYLFDYNMELTLVMLRLLKLNQTYSFTETYLDPANVAGDYRTIIHPKKDTGFKTKTYFQVFEDRNGFLPNLSVLDLLCSQGPQSAAYL